MIALRGTLRIVAAGALIFSCALPFPANATAVEREIELLLGRLAASGCEFERNATWHAAEAVRTHLLRKRDALARRGAIESSEQFVELAGSGSNTSGKPYRVRCGGSAPVDSRIWLLEQRRLLRQTGGAAKGS
ncbi:MAG TPA: DUF5329 family protein [Rhodocyclaceae bacterium]